MTSLKLQLLSSPAVVKHFLSLVSSITLNSNEAFANQLAHIKAISALSQVQEKGMKMYKVYSIPKRSGGNRVIAHPSKELKIFQRALNDIFEGQLPIHQSAYAYRKKRSIKDNALAHVENQYLVKMDFLNFFNSIDEVLLKDRFVKQAIVFTDEDYLLLKGLVFWSPTKTNDGKAILSVGAPSSPMLSNFVMYEFDSLISTVCDSLKVSYTRYADDLFFSTNKENVLKDIPNIVRYFVDYIYGDSLRLNESKTVFTSKAHNRHVTGIVINNSDQLSLGRERKRYIRTMVFNAINGKASIQDLTKLQGLLSYSQSIEPTFIESLFRKYSEDKVRNLISAKWRV